MRLAKILNAVAIWPGVCLNVAGRDSRVEVTGAGVGAGACAGAGRG